MSQDKQANAALVAGLAINRIKKDHLPQFANMTANLIGAALLGDDFAQVDALLKEFEILAQARKEYHTAEFLTTMEGHEVWSQDWGDCVGVKNGQFWANGAIVCDEPTIAQINALWDEFTYQELGY